MVNVDRKNVSRTRLHAVGAAAAFALLVGLSAPAAALAIACNVTPLHHVLSSVAGSEVECLVGDAASSALLSFPSEAEFKYVVMPMRI